MRARTRRTSIFRGVLRGLGLTAVVVGASCSGFDSTRIAPPKATLGDDMFGVLCDRVGAGSLTDDLTGASYHAVCHYSNTGAYADEVDESYLPKVTTDARVNARTLGIAKVEAMARRRSDLVRAFNAIFPDEEIDDVTTEATGDTVNMHDALLTFSQQLSVLYETNPFEPTGAPSAPASTRAMGDIFAALMDSEPARKAMSSVWGRQNYKPHSAGLGITRPLLSYPRLRPLLIALLDVLAPEGKIAPELVQILRVVSRDMATFKSTISALSPIIVDAATAQPSRPMETMEMVSRIMLDQHPSYAKDPAAAPTWIAKRDRRGWVTPYQNIPGQSGTVLDPFADTNGDGYADINEFGQFITANNTPVSGLPPFNLQGTAGTDGWGRPEPQMYEYIDTSRTLIGSFAQDLGKLVDSTQYAPNAGDDAWKDERETLMYALAGANILLGDREDAVYDLDTEEIKPAGTTCASCIPYKRFRGEDSPLPDLAHALGQILADPDSDVLVQGLLDLVENHDTKVARLLGAMLKMREIAAQHDVLAAQGKEKEAKIPYETPIWDELAGILNRITSRPGLTSKVIGAFADPVMVTPFGGSAHVGETFANLMKYTDKLNYYPDDINAAAQNLSTMNFMDPSVPVDRSKPALGDNRSCWETAIDAIHSANRVKACNKQGAKVKAALGGINLTWPLLGSGYDECELLSFENLAVFYLDSVLPANHPKRAEFKIKAGELDALLNFLGIFTSKDKLFEDSSGINGLTLKPESAALNRLVFFGATSGQFPNMPDLDPFIGGKNKKTNDFISGLIEPIGTAVCNITPQGTRKCDTQEDTLRLRGKYTLFLLERFGFYDYLRPLVVTFANATCSPNCEKDAQGNFKTDGEEMVLDLISVMKRHWPGPDHGSECTGTGDANSNPKYCSGAGLNSYEPIIVDSLQTDIVPALAEAATVVRDISKVTISRGPKAGQVWTGADVLEAAMRIVFNQDYAKNVGMKDRRGNTTTTWSDGTPQSQITGFTLFADAFRAMDLRFDNACSCDGKMGQELSDCQAAYDTCRVDAERRKGQWKRARSQLVDQFMGIEGTGANAKFANSGIPRLLSTSLRAFREQVNAHCPDRESGGGCSWAKTEMGQTVADGLSGPMVAATVDLLEKIRQNEAARREIEKLLEYMLTASSPDQALESTLTTVADVLQLLLSDKEMEPILNAVSAAAEPENASGAKGTLPATLQLLKALTSDQYDKYHVMDHVLPNLVTPMNGGKGPAPMEIIMDTVAEVNRLDASIPATEPQLPEDYEAIFRTTRDFLTSETRGLEQIYTIVQKRPRE